VDRFAPVESPAEAVAFAAARGFVPYAADQIPKGHTSIIEDGFLVQVVNKFTGCSDNVFGSIYKVTQTGEVSHVAQGVTSLADPGLPVLCY